MDPRPGSVEEAAEKILRGVRRIEGDEESSEEETGNEEERQDEVVDEAPEQESDEVVDDASTEDETGEEEEEEGGEEEPPETGGEEEDEGEEVSTLHELAEAIDVEPEFLYSIKVPFTDPNGKRAEFTLSQIKDQFQELSRFKEERNRFEQDRQTFENERQEVMGRLNTRLTEAEEVLTSFEKALEDELYSPEMRELRKERPEEWAARRQEFDDRKAKLREQRERLKEDANKTKEETQKELQQRLATVSREEASKLLKAVPEWNDEEVRTREVRDVVDYLKGMGASDQELAQVVDHRFFVIARKAMLHDKGKKKVQVAKKKVKRLTKRISPKPNAEPGKAEADGVKRRRARLKKTGSIRDAAAVINDRLFGGT